MTPQPSGGFEWVQAAGGPALVCVPLQRHAGHLFTTRDWKLGSSAQPADEDWLPVATSLHVEPTDLVRLHQVHGASVAVRRNGERQALSAPPDADIVVSDDPALALAIQTADCVPLLLADVIGGAVAAAHAGWRGLAAGVPGATVAALGREFGTLPGDLIVAVGPSISVDRYEVGADVRARFVAARWPSSRLERWFVPGARPDHWLFDGWQAVRDQLESAGVPAESIHTCELCTASHPDLLCSYRRDGKGAGRMAAAIRKSHLAG